MFEIVGASAWAEHTRRVIRQVAKHPSSVLIVGPSGTGKELIARAIHAQSPRAAGPLVPVDCTAIPPGLFASQLFGHVRGAFSGAECDTLGCFRAADGGTIFLDEIGELSLELQVQLLRVIQERAVFPVGSHRGVPVNVRLIAATNRNLAEEVLAGRFRLDLYYRLNVVHLGTTPLAERPEDIAPLCVEFLDRLSVEHGMEYKRLSPAAVRLLQGCPWPGNVRQLQNVLERAVVFTEAKLIEAADLLPLLEPEEIPSFIEPALGGDLRRQSSFPASKAFEPDHSCRRCGGLQPACLDGASGEWPSLAECQRRLISAALEECFHNQSAAARLLQIDRRLLARKMRKYGISADPSWHKPTEPKRT